MQKYNYLILISLYKLYKSAYYRENFYLHFWIFWKTRKIYSCILSRYVFIYHTRKFTFTNYYDLETDIEKDVKSN